MRGTDPVKGHTFAELRQTMEFLAKYPMARLSLEDRLNTAAAEGVTHRIDEYGMGRIYGPVIRTRVVLGEDGKLWSGS